MPGIADKLASIWESIVSLPGLIVDGIIDGLKFIFIPDTDVLLEKFNNCVKEIKIKVGLSDFSAFYNLFDAERPVEDIKENYKIPGVGTFNFTFLDTSFLKDGVAYFRPFIRGFIILLCFFFNIRQLVGFFGYSSGDIQKMNE